MNTRHKSNNYCYQEQSYAEARRSQYMRKHNINSVNELKRRNVQVQENDQDSDSDEYYQLIRRRIGLALLDNNNNGNNMRNSSLRKPVVHPTINDDTTNSDDSDSYHEQAFHQHHTREERVKENEKLRHEMQREQMQAAREETTNLLRKVDRDGQPAQMELNL